ncbi:Oidioi.mRNA.OKI2018_I69.XSR.g16267.t1.cds [Oikopleura dioica]|nr:Oidioi.mRNA.OKI2018_I69.XSR.g16267.t1.cds [Oikopleura dioica]
MTQNNYAQGKFGRNIKLNCNATFLCRNCLDGTVNKRACSQAGLLKAYKRATEENKNKQYPYMFLDQSPRGHASSYRLYTDIFTDYPVVFSVSGMKACIVPYNDFKQNFDIIARDNTFEAVEKKHEKKYPECKTIESTRVKSKIRCDSFTEDSSESEVERSRSRKRNKKSSNDKKSKRKAKKRRRHSTSSEASSETDEEEKSKSKKSKRRRPSTSSESDSENISSDEVDSKSKKSKRRRNSSSSESPTSEEVSSGGSDSSPVRKRGKRSSILSESSGISPEE